MSGGDNSLEDSDGGLRSDGDVRLVVPAAPEYLRLVRLTAAGLASRLGFTFDEVEDLRIAVDELCYTLLGDLDDTGPAAARTMDLVYSAGGDFIVITGRTAALDGPVPEPSDLSEQILDALVDEHELCGDNGTLQFRLKKQRDS